MFSRNGRSPEVARPRVGVVMAVYAGANPGHLEEALASLTEQTLFPADVVLVEDGPLTGKLHDVVESFEGTQLPLRRVALDRRSGSGPAKQRGLEEVRAELVAIADADDISLPTRLELQATVMEEQAVDVLGAAVEEIDAQTRQILGVRRFPEGDAEIRNRMRLVNPLNHPTVMLRRSVALRAGGYANLPLLEDYHLWARIAGSGAVLGNCPEVLVQFRGGKSMLRRRRSAQALAAEWELQRTLRREGIISAWAMPINWFVRNAFRLLPSSLLGLAYRRLFLAGGRRSA